MRTTRTLMRALYDRVLKKENDWKSKRQDWRKHPEQLEQLRVNVVFDVLEEENIPAEYQKNKNFHRMRLTIMIVTAIKVFTNKLTHIANEAEKENLLNQLIAEMETHTNKVKTTLQEEEQARKENELDSSSENIENKFTNEFDNTSIKTKMQSKPAISKTKKQSKSKASLKSNSVVVRSEKANTSTKEPDFAPDLAMKHNDPILKRDLYKELGVKPTATKKEIKKAYFKLALKTHSDHNLDSKEEADEKMKDINTAYEIIGDEDKRSFYDEHSTAYGTTPTQQQDNTANAVPSG